MNIKRVLIMVSLSFVAALGCGVGPDLIGAVLPATPTASSILQAVPATLPPSATQPPPTPPATTGAAAFSTASPGSLITYPVKVVYQDAGGDCIANADGAPMSCNPAGLDIVSMTASRQDAKGAVTLNLELAGNGVKDLRGTPVWGMMYAFDLDRNIAMGLKDVYPTQHHIGPDLTILYSEVNGKAQELVKRYDSTGNGVDADASLAKWSFSDNNHIQLVVAASLIPVEQFYLVGDLVDSEAYDHFVEEGYLTFPEGQAVVQKTSAPSATAGPSSAPPLQGSSSAGVIVSAVMAQGVKGLKAPVGVTNQFPAGQGEIHAVVETSNAPVGTKIKVVWIAVDVGSAAAPNFKMGEYEGDFFGTEYVDFSFDPNGGQMVPGKYRVELYLNGSLDRSLDFSVAGPGTRVPSATSPSMSVGHCPASTSPKLLPSGFIAKVTTTTGTKGASLDPVDTTTVFNPSARLHVVVTTKDAPPNTKFSIRWFATDVGDAAPCNATLSEPTDLTTGGSSNLDFSVSPATKWPVGMYLVEIYVNDVLDSTAAFTVK